MSQRTGVFRKVRARMFRLPGMITCDRAEELIDGFCERGKDEPVATVAGATPYLHLFGAVASSWALSRGALAAARPLHAGSNDPFYAAKLATARFYAEQILPPAAALLGPITRGADNLFAIPPNHL